MATSWELGRAGVWSEAVTADLCSPRHRTWRSVSYFAYELSILSVQSLPDADHILTLLVQDCINHNCCFPVRRSPIINSRWPRPIGTRASITFKPVCNGSDTAYVALKGSWCFYWTRVLSVWISPDRRWTTKRINTTNQTFTYWDWFFLYGGLIAFTGYL